MSGIVLAFALLVFAWLADLVAKQWGFTGKTKRSFHHPRSLPSRSMSSRLKGQSTSRPAQRSTGIR